jgi:hypothetical protein
VHASPDIAIPDNSYDVRGIRISTVGGYRRYGRVRIVPKGGQGDNALGLVRRRNGAWKLVNLGTSGVGCNLPAAVQRDLRIDDC